MRTDGIGHLLEVAYKRSTCKFQDVKEKSSCSVLDVKSICAVKRIVIVLLDFILNKLFL